MRAHLVFASSGTAALASAVLSAHGAAVVDFFGGSARAAMSAPKAPLRVVGSARPPPGVTAGGGLRVIGADFGLRGPGERLCGCGCG